MKKAFIIFLSLVVMASVGVGSATVQDGNDSTNVTNNSVLSPTANAVVNNSGNSQNVNTNTIIVKSTNVNRQIQVQATPKTIVVYVKAVPVTNSSNAAAGGETAEAGNATNVPMEDTGFNFVPLLVGIGGLAGGYLASRRFG
jgi:hypothetical protein